jgi:enediyne biosynthesis protein E4
MLLATLIALQTVLFHDATAELGLALDTSAACWVDVDSDGWSDLCAGGAVWRNMRGTKFTKVADVPGPIVAADFDNDGFPDLFSWGQRKLYRNEQGKAFTEFALPEMPASVSRGACWGDFDNDGFADLYIGGYEDWDKGITYPSFLLLNQGGKRFSVAMTDARYRARGVTACDFNQDGSLDVYVSNYRLQPNVLWVNDGKAGFKDRTAELGAVATSEGFPGGHSIGSCWGDFDSDGLFDLFAGNFAHRDSRGDQPKSRFLRNLGPAGGYKLKDMGTCGIFYQESYATPAAGDFDNDGRLDLFFTTVYGTASFGVRNSPVLYQNLGGFTFADVSLVAGLSDLPPTYQAAWADFDRDGRLDLVTGGKLFRNSRGGGNWLEIRLTGDGKKVNRAAIGAQVRVRLGGKTFTRQVEAGTGEGNQNDLTLHFGLGDASRNPDVEIAWPNGSRQRLGRVSVNRLVELRFRG